MTRYTYEQLCEYLGSRAATLDKEIEEIIKSDSDERSTFSRYKEIAMLSEIQDRLWRLEELSH